jgi:ABC-type nitrate/sulfonate/bicarbonate transport system permease component
MLGTLARGEPSRLWAIALVVSGVSLILFYGLGGIRKLVERRLGTTATIRDQGVYLERFRLPDIAWDLASVLVAWSVFAFLVNLPSPLVLGPVELIHRLTHDPEGVAALWAALKESIPLTIASLLLGILISGLWALIGRLYPTTGRILTSSILVTQAVPILALTPVFVLMLGRGVTITIVIAVLAVIFPGYAVIAQRLDTIPHELQYLSEMYGSSKWRRARAIDIPWAAYGVLTAVRIAAPRALLGVMLAEYLATGRGLGFLLAMARGRVDFTLVWAGVVATAVVGLVLNRIAAASEYYLQMRSQAGSVSGPMPIVPPRKGIEL